MSMKAEQFVVSGEVLVKFSNYPGKRGLISSSPDKWSVMLEVKQRDGTKTVTLREWSEDAAEIKGYYDKLKEFFKEKV